jgi:hypothetical protein
MNPNTLTVPSPFREAGDAPLHYDLTEINAAKARVHEIAIVNSIKSPELMSVFARACFTLASHFSDLHLKHRQAEKWVANRRAVLILDVIPEQSKIKGVGNNEATRQAFLDIDDEYNKASNAEAHLDAALVLIREDLRNMEKCLSSVKAILAETSGLQYRTNPNLSTGGMDSDDRREAVLGVTSDAPVQQTQTFGGMKVGKPRY